MENGADEAEACATRIPEPIIHKADEEQVDLGSGPLCMESRKPSGPGRLTVQAAGAEAGELLIASLSTGRSANPGHVCAVVS